jgi:hypothetical protein
MEDRVSHLGEVLTRAEKSIEKEVEADREQLKRELESVFGRQD